MYAQTPFKMCTIAVFTLFLALVADAKNLAVGANHACVAQSDGALYCFGGNVAPSGTYSAIDISAFPTQVTSVTKAVDVTAGDGYTCYVDEVSSVKTTKCFGKNDVGQLGDGTLVDRENAIVVSNLGLPGFRIQAGQKHTCAILNKAQANGRMMCWGSNSHGQLGNGETSVAPVSTPVQVVGYETYGPNSMSAGLEHTCITRPTNPTNTAYCTGNNDYGQLGVGDFQPRTTFTQVTGTYFTITCGAYHTCAVTAAAGIVCWGANTMGQLGDGTLTSRSTPLSPSGLSGNAYTYAAGGLANTFIIVQGAATVRSFGDNTCGQLATGDKVNYNTPQLFGNEVGNVKEVRSGKSHTCVLYNDGTVQCVGCDDKGQLGNGKPLQQSDDLVDVPIITDGPTQSPTGAPTPMIADPYCAPKIGTNAKQCKAKIKTCKKQGIIMKWTPTYCVKKHITGCQCNGYCNYPCKRACNKDAMKQCKWDAKAKVCRVKATGLPAVGIPQCWPEKS